jgi:hypothetical protein
LPQVYEMSERRDVVAIVPTLDTNANTGGRVVLDSLTVTDGANQKAALTVLFFESDPTAATITNNAAFALSTDLTKVVGKVNVLTTDYETIDSKAVACLRGLNLTLEASGSATIYAACLTTGTPTYAVSSLRFCYGFRV